MTQATPLLHQADFEMDVYNDSVGISEWADVSATFSPPLNRFETAERLDCTRNLPEDNADDKYLQNIPNEILSGGG